MKLDAFTRQYIATALWSSNDESDESGGSPLDENYTEDDLAPETLARIKADCADFQQRLDEFGSLETDYDAEHAGHDFWLTRNGHGAGFWDGDWGEQGDELTKLAKAFPAIDLYVGDDGLLYIA